LIGLRTTAVAAGHMVKHCSVANPVETLYRSLADNPVDTAIESILRCDLVILVEVSSRRWTTPDTVYYTGRRLLFRLAAAAYERRSPALGTTGISDRGPLPAEHTTVSILDNCCTTPPPSASSTNCCTTPPLSECLAGRCTMPLS
jgi:hypothetical protein